MTPRAEVFELGCVTSMDKEVQTNVDLQTDTGDSDNNVDEERCVILQSIDRE